MANFDQEKNMIVGILQFTEKLPDHLIERLPATEKELFRKTWDEQVKVQFAEVVSQIQSVQAEGSPLWTGIARAGLTGPSLDLKKHLLASAASEGLLRRFLRILNSWLGSLADAIPGVHPVKELKELLEEFLQECRRARRRHQDVIQLGRFRAVRNAIGLRQPAKRLPDAATPFSTNAATTFGDAPSTLQIVLLDDKVCYRLANGRIARAYF
ncbi:MAG: hypothetical protein ABSH32_10770 [Bryobacteraceae bacterium]|jgi:hypothetical protein